jgi:hypothetical protein
VLGSTLIRDQVVQVCEPCQNPPLAPSGMLKGFHHEPLPVDGVLRLLQRKHPHALAMACPGPQGVALRVHRLAHRGGDGHQSLWERDKRVAQAEAETPSRTARPQTLRGAVQAIGADSVDSG